MQAVPQNVISDGSPAIKMVIKVLSQKCIELRILPSFGYIMTVKRNKTKIRKASGEIVDFNEGKLQRSLKRSGANVNSIASIIKEISNNLYEGISTKEIYKKAFAMLRKQSHPTAARYKLKQAIYELGPSGFPFEKFVAEILKQEGYKTRVGVIVNGHCVNHEVDVIAQKDAQHFMVECKFHSQQGRNCDVKIPLYINSRFIDVEKSWKKMLGHEVKFHQGWIYTNTRFTGDAIQYSSCSGLKLVSWDYPKTESLRERINTLGLHPLTCLTTLTRNEKTKLLEKDIVLCMDLCQRPKLLDIIGVNKSRHKKILNEASELCKNIK